MLDPHKFPISILCKVRSFLLSVCEYTVQFISFALHHLGAGALVYFYAHIPNLYKIPDEEPLYTTAQNAIMKHIPTEDLL